MYLWRYMKLPLGGHSWVGHEVHGVGVFTHSNKSPEYWLHRLEISRMIKKGMDGVHPLWSQPLSSMQLVNILCRHHGGCLGWVAFQRATPRLLWDICLSALGNAQNLQSISPASSVCWRRMISDFYHHAGDISDQMQRRRRRDNRPPQREPSWMFFCSCNCV